MAGRYDKVAGVWTPVKKRYDKVSGAWAPVKTRYAKVGGVWVPAYKAFPDQISAQGSGYYRWSDDEKTYTNEGAIDANFNFYVDAYALCKDVSKGHQQGAYPYLTIRFSSSIHVDAGQPIIKFSSLGLSYSGPSGQYGNGTLTVGSTQVLSMWSFPIVTGTEYNLYNYTINAPTALDFTEMTFNVHATAIKGQYGDNCSARIDGTITSIIGEPVAGKTINPNIWDNNGSYS